MFLVEARSISKCFYSTTREKEAIPVVENFTLQLREGELVTFFGPNGCGKTTILGLLAGTIEPDAGEVVWNAEVGTAIPLGYVFQNYADTLLPWRTVRSNIAFPLELRKLPKQERDDKTRNRMEQFGLTEHAAKYVYELSGGLKQLVAIARATVYEPRLLLLDEPFSSLDYSLSRTLWTRFHRFWSGSKVTTAFVSHNVDEAVFLGDKVYVLSPRPTRILAEIPVPFGNDRNLGILSSPDFFAIRSAVLNAFEQGRT